MIGHGRTRKNAERTKAEKPASSLHQLEEKHCDSGTTALLQVPRSSAFFRGLLLVIALLLLAAGAQAQGCSMCYNNAAQADAHQRTALRRGILVLGIPAAMIICGIALAAYKSDRKDGEEEDS